MSLKIKVYSDYVCPFCFLAKHPFEEAIKGKEVEVEWLPFELRPDPYEPLDPINDPSKLALWERAIYPAINKLGINMKLPNVSPHPYTGLAFEGFHFAKAHGKEKEYNNKIFIAFFQEEKNIGELNVLVDVAKQIGLDVNQFKDALEKRQYKQTQQEALKHAYEEANISAVPTFKIGNTVVSGMVSKEEFERIINAELNNVTKNPTQGMSCDLDGNCL